MTIQEPEEESGLHSLNTESIKKAIPNLTVELKSESPRLPTDADED